MGLVQSQEPLKAAEGGRKISQRDGVEEERGEMQRKENLEIRGIRRTLPAFVSFLKMGKEAPAKNI